MDKVTMGLFDRVRAHFAPSGLIAEAAILAFEAEMIDGGYVEWMMLPPFNGTWIEARRREWNATCVWQAGGERPEMNVAGLYWRPCRGPLIEGKVIEGNAA